MTARQRKIVERAEDRSNLVTSLWVTGALIAASTAIFVPLMS